MQSKRMIEKINEIKNSHFEKITKINKTLALNSRGRKTHNFILQRLF